MRSITSHTLIALLALMLALIGFGCGEAPDYSESLEDTDLRTDSYSYTPDPEAPLDGSLHIGITYRNTQDTAVFLSRGAHLGILNHEIEIQENRRWNLFHTPLRSVDPSQKIEAGEPFHDTITVYSPTGKLEWQTGATYRIRMLLFGDAQMADTLDTLYSNYFRVE